MRSRIIAILRSEFLRLGPIIQGNEINRVANRLSTVVLRSRKLVTAVGAIATLCGMVTFVGCKNVPRTAPLTFKVSVKMLELRHGTLNTLKNFRNSLLLVQALRAVTHTKLTRPPRLLYAIRLVLSSK